jgi:hypothetical protein
MYHFAECQSTVHDKYKCKFINKWFVIQNAIFLTAVLLTVPSVILL